MFVFWLNSATVNQINGLQGKSDRLLGGYVHDRTTQELPTLVIHSIPMWLLAEGGLVGFALVGAAAIALLWGALRMARTPAANGRGTALLIMLAAMVGGGLVHDFLYQRTFWLMLGLVLAVPLTTGAIPAHQSTKG